MNKQECIKQLEDLKQHCQYQSQDNDPIWNDDVQALDMAIEELRRTAPEVPVQEQSNSVINIQVDGKQIAQVVLKELAKMQKQSSSRLTM